MILTHSTSSRIIGSGERFHMNDDIGSMVRACASTHSDMPLHSITDDTTFDELGMDSLGCICLVVDVEDATGIQIGCGDRISFDTVGDIIDFVSARTLPLAA